MPSQTDVVAPFDPTGYTSITSAQLLQLVSGLAPYADKGFIIQTTDALSGVDPLQSLEPNVPNAIDETKWQRYLWIRISPSVTNNGVTTSPIIAVYAWNPGAAVGALLQWVPVGVGTIGAGSIVGSQIAAGTISDINIADVAWNKIIGVPTLAPSNNSITTDMIINGAVTLQKLSASGLPLQIPRINVSGTSLEFVQQNKIAYTPNPNAAQAGYPLVVASDGSGYVVGTPAPSSNQINQLLKVSDVAPYYTSIAHIGTGSTPTYATMALITGLVPPPMVPLGSSRIIIDAIVHVGSSNVGNVIIGLFLGTVLVAVASAYVPNSLAIVPVRLLYTEDNTDGSPRQYSLMYAPTVNSQTAFINKSSGSANSPWGGKLVSSIVITEI